jgi:hypothetical protein
MGSYEGISAEQANEILNNEDGLLVNGYDVPEKWEDTKVTGAIPFTQFQRLVAEGKVDPKAKIMFYCA